MSATQTFRHGTRLAIHHALSFPGSAGADKGSFCTWRLDADGDVIHECDADGWNIDVIDGWNIDGCGTVIDGCGTDAIDGCGTDVSVRTDDCVVNSAVRGGDGACGNPRSLRQGCVFAVSGRLVSVG